MSAPVAFVLLWTLITLALLYGWEEIAAWHKRGRR